MHLSMTAMSDETPTVSAHSTAPPPQEISDAIEVPYAVHRWFASGEGWAYHPEIDPGLVQRWAARILARSNDVWQPTPDSSQLREALGYEPLPNDPEHRLVVYRHYADQNCPDPKAQHRFPTVLIVALAHDLNDAEIEEVQRQLSALDDEVLPQAAGCRDSLKLVVSRIARPSANDEPITTDNIPASVPPDVHPHVQRPAHRFFKPVILCVSVLVLLAISVVTYLGLFPPEANDWSQVKPTSSSPPEQNRNGGSSPPATSHFAATSSLDNTNTKSVDNQFPGSASPVQTQPKNENSWRKEAAEAMLHHLKRWRKSGPLISDLGHVPSLRREARQLLEANLEDMDAKNQKDQIMVMGRFFLVLSQQPVKHLLNHDVLKHTWQGKFMLQFRDEHPYAKGANPKWYPETEQELRQWLQELEQWFINRPPGAPKDPVADALNIRSHGKPDTISALVNRVAGRIDYTSWKQAVESVDPKFEDCIDTRLKKWVEDFTASTNGRTE